MKKLGDKIYDLRIKYNLKQADIGAIVGVTRQTVSQWEANQCAPKLEKLKIIADYFRVDIKYFTSEAQDIQPFLLDNKVDDTAEEVTCDVAQDSSLEVAQIEEPPLEQTEDDNLSDDINDEDNQQLDGQAQDDTASSQKKSIIKKVKIALSVTVPTLIVGLIIAFICILFVPHKGGLDTAVSRAFKFDSETIIWTVFIAVVIFVVIIASFCVHKAIKRRKNL